MVDAAPAESFLTATKILDEGLMSFASTVSRVKQSDCSPVIAALVIALLAPAIGAAQAQTLPLAARAKGSLAAPVTVYEMADFQCPVCKTFVGSVWPTLEKEFVNTGKVRWIFINFPLASIHANAVAAAEFASCAAKDGKFWPTHDMLYATQESWEKLRDPVPFFRSKIGSLGLKPDAMNACLTSGAAAAMVQDDASGAQRSGANSTPSFYIEGGMIAGLYPLAVYQQILDSVYKAKTTKG
jgi:protein-disulfide isomerase